MIPHLFHVIQGARYHRQAGRHFNPFVFDDIKTIADHLHYVGDWPHSGNGISAQVGGGHAHCGAMVYLGDRFPARFRNAVFMSNIHGNRINTDLLERRGSGLVGRHGPDFLLAEDLWFRGINLRYGPDGNVFLIDWYDQQACHRTVPEIWDRSNGRLYKVSYGETHSKRVDLAGLPSTELVALQLHANDWYVRHARRLLQERGPDRAVHTRLRKIIEEHPVETRRLRALWALHVTGGLDERLGLKLLADRHDSVRAWTVQCLLEDGPVSSKLRAALQRRAASDRSPRVRLYLASALQRLPSGARWPLIEGLLGHGEDRDDHNLPLMLWYGFEPLVATEPKRALDLARHGRLPQVARFVVRRLAAGEASHLDVLVAELRSADDAWRRTLLGGMIEELKTRRDVAMPARWRETRATLLMSEDAEVRRDATTLAVSFGDRELFPRLQRIVADRGRDADVRVRALEDLLRVRDAGLPEILHRLLDERALCSIALRALGRYDHPETAERIIARWTSFDAAASDGAARTLAGRAAWARVLLEAVEDGRVPRAALERATVRRLVSGHGDAALDALLTGVWGRSRAVETDKQALILAWRRRLRPEVLAAADLPRGRAVFARTCMSCHKLFGVGREIGPDLSGSNRADLAYILTNVIDPSAEVAKEYVGTMLQTEDGRLVDGLLVAENADTITIRTEREDLVIPRSEIARDGRGKARDVVSREVGDARRSTARPYGRRGARPDRVPRVTAASAAPRRRADASLPLRWREPRVLGGRSEALVGRGRGDRRPQCDGPGEERLLAQPSPARRLSARAGAASRR